MWRAAQVAARGGGRAGGWGGGGRARGPDAVEMDVVPVGDSRRKPRLGPAAQAAESGPFTGRRRAALKDSLRSRVHSRPRRRRHVQVKYTGAPVATMPRPIRACTGRATIVFPTIAAAAAMNSAGVTG